MGVVKNSENSVFIAVSEVTIVVEHFSHFRITSRLVVVVEDNGAVVVVVVVAAAVAVVVAVMVVVATVVPMEVIYLPFSFLILVLGYRNRPTKQSKNMD